MRSHVGFLRAQSSRLAEFGGLGMSFSIWRSHAWQLGNVHRDKESGPTSKPKKQILK
jgi:hypothetical protein